MKRQRYRFFQNRKCEYFPCHKTDDPKGFNCLMCYCPLYFLPECGGNYALLASGLKDCSDCLKPHYDYDGVLERLNREFEAGRPAGAFEASEEHD